jgi:hypothetical protein
VKGTSPWQFPKQGAYDKAILNKGPFKLNHCANDDVEIEFARVENLLQRWN